jgi:O-antigen/teichoic acid export membrane protein
MFEKVKKHFNSEYIRNFSALAGSEGIAQAIQIGVSPLLTRIYTPVEFGQYELFKSIALLLTVVGFLQYDVSIYSAKTEKESIQGFALSSLILIFICVLAGIFIYFFNDFFIRLIGSNIKEGWSWTIPVYVLFSGGTTLLLVWLTKMGSFVLLSKLKILVSILVAGTQVLFGYFNMGYWGLIYSTIIVQIIAFLLFFYPFLKDNFKNLTQIDFPGLIKTCKENWRLPLIVLPGNFLNNFVQTLPVFFLGKVDPSILGYFSLARRIIDFPLKFITAAVQRLYVKELTDEIAATGIGKVSFIKNLKLYTFIAVSLFFGILTLTKPLLPFLFGEEWKPAVPYVIVLSLLFSIRFIFGSLSFVMVLGKAPKLDLIWQIGFGLIIFLSFKICEFFHLNSFQTIIVYVFSGIFSYLIYGFVCKKVAETKELLTF